MLGTDTASTAPGSAHWRSVRSACHGSIRSSSTSATISTTNGAPPSSPSQMPSIVPTKALSTPWELRPWLELPERYEVSYLLTGSNRFATPDGLRAVPARALRDLLPRGPLGELSAGVLGDRYLSANEAFAHADIVHAAELSFWFAADAARRRRRGGFRLVQTV